ncbi:DUF5060 domain-containing protein [Lutibacter citreus]|uniref:DUF5060 domain-containing protein n=1 Tax=Lutibacter citreus TaxID=2138210 RepID=UPI000DBE3F6C|nr:DUF5060 domain-containing protein [Lutibacter citreus]
MKKQISLLILFILTVFITELQAQKIDGELKKWHKLTLVFDGPECSENDEFNPFYNYRLDVSFKHNKTGKTYLIPGYFAADGNAGQTSATSGNKWKVHFSPDEIGEWSYSVKFIKGKWAAVRTREKGAPSGKFMDGTKGNFTIKPTDKVGSDFRGRGRLKYDGTPYLKLAEKGEVFYKCGSDAPENFLSYYAFDGDFASDGHKDNLVKKWSAHLKDWKNNNPIWKDGKGKEIIGAVNYLASKGMNSVSFLTNNISGDDQNVFPYINYDTFDRFDCSKLDQWEIVFEHAQELGIFLHFKTLEYENQGLLDAGAIGGLTKLYYRELIARFGHHLALNWNLCEEIGDWGNYDKIPTMPLDDYQRRALSEYIYSVDAYHHHMVIHNGNWYDAMYGNKSKLTGASLQTNKADFSKVHEQVIKVLAEAKAAGKVWAVACDEPGDAQHSLITDEEDPEHYFARTNGLWGAMLAGAWGTEWYFGYKHPHSDLSCEDYRSRDKFWEMGKICLDFFTKNNLPVDKMTNNDSLISNKNDYCFSLEGDTYVILLKKGGEAKLNLKSYLGEYSIQWYNPRIGGELQNSNIKTVKGGNLQSLGNPPKDMDKDWVVLVKKIS